MSRRALALLLGMAAPGCGSSTDGLPIQETCPAPARMDVGAAASRLTAALGTAGYTVQEGSMHFFRVEDCMSLDNCFGNNPTSPYGFYCLPPAPGANAVDNELQKI